MNTKHGLKAVVQHFGPGSTLQVVPITMSQEALGDGQNQYLK